MGFVLIHGASNTIVKIKFVIYLLIPPSRIRLFSEIAARATISLNKVRVIYFIPVAISVKATSPVGIFSEKASISPVCATHIQSTFFAVVHGQFILKMSRPLKLMHHLSENKHKRNCMRGT